MSARDRKLLKIIVPIAVVAALWLLIFSPRLDDMKSAKTEVDTANAALAQANAKVSALRVTRKQIRAQRKRLAAASRAVPASLAIPSLLRQLDRSANRSGVSLDAVAQGGGDAASPAMAAAEAAGVDATGVSLTFVGRYRNVRRFMTKLDKLVRISNQTVEGTGRLISLSTISVDPTERRLTVQVQATVYTLKPGTATPATSGATPAASSGGSTPAVSAAVVSGG